MTNKDKALDALAKICYETIEYDEAEKCIETIRRALSYKEINLENLKATSVEVEADPADYFAGKANGICEGWNNCIEHLQDKGYKLVRFPNK